jgi:hypothetical protein
MRVHGGPEPAEATPRTRSRRRVAMPCFFLQLPSGADRSDGRADQPAGWGRSAAGRGPAGAGRHDVLRVTVTMSFFRGGARVPDHARRYEETEENGSVTVSVTMSVKTHLVSLNRVAGRGRQGSGANVMVSGIGKPALLGRRRGGPFSDRCGRSDARRRAGREAAGTHRRRRRPKARRAIRTVPGLRRAPAAQRARGHAPASDRVALPTGCHSAHPQEHSSVLWPLPGCRRVRDCPDVVSCQGRSELQDV